MKYITKRWGMAMPAGITYEYRRDPVPFTRCRRGAHYGNRYLKKPHTMQEARFNFLDEDSNGVKLRASRCYRNLPNHYDDRVRADIDIKNWKRFRRTQYKT